MRCSVHAAHGSCVGVCRTGGGDLLLVTVDTESELRGLSGRRRFGVRDRGCTPRVGGVAGTGSEALWAVMLLLLFLLPLLVAGWWLVAAGCWLPAAGCWLLAAG